MGAANKLLLPVDGRPMVRRVADQYRAALDGPITVVTGHEATDVQTALDGAGVCCVYNPEHEKGQQSSVAFGLAHAPDADVLLIGLGDQPLLQATDIRALVQAHQAADPSKISIPAMDAIRGNPIAVPHILRSRLTADRDRPGCMRFTRDNPALVQRLLLPAAGFYSDVDTPDDYAALRTKSEKAT